MKYVRPINLFQDMLKLNASTRGRLLGLDVGDKYVGLAVSDYHNQIASPLRVLLRKKTNIDLMANDFRSLISEFSLSGFIFGYPFYRSKNSPQAIQVKLFVEDLCRTGVHEGLSYTFWDECFTSKITELMLKDLHMHPVRIKSTIDKFAAVGILQRVQRNLAILNKRTRGGCSCLCLLLSVLGIVGLVVAIWLLVKYL